MEREVIQDPKLGPVCLMHMASSDEFAQYCRFAPETVPDGHVRVVDWVRSPARKGMPTMRIYAVPLVVCTATPEQQQAMVDKMASEPGGEKLPGEPPATPGRLDELLSMREADLLDLAPRVGVTNGMKLLSKNGKRHLAAAILKGEQGQAK